MSRLIRMDQTGHTTLAEWTAADAKSAEAAVAALRRELDAGDYAVVSEGEGRATQGDTLPLDAELVILRRPAPGGGWRSLALRARHERPLSSRARRRPLAPADGRAPAAPLR